MGGDICCCGKPVGIVKCAHCMLGYCSAKCKKLAARGHKSECALRLSKNVTTQLVETHYKGGSLVADELMEGMISVYVKGEMAFCIEAAVKYYIYGIMTEGFLMIKSRNKYYPAMTEEAVTDRMNSMLTLMWREIRVLVGPPPGCLLLECSSYADFARKMQALSLSSLRWCADNEIVGGRPALEGIDSALQDRERGYTVIRVCVQHPDMYDAAGCALYSYNRAFVIGEK